jgi:protein-tyrosine phosphatase
MSWWQNWKQKRGDEAGYKRKSDLRKNGKDMMGLSKVADRLWIGGAVDVLDTNQIEENNIDFVLNVCRKETKARVYFWVPLNDYDGNTLQQFYDCVCILRLHYRAGDNCLIQCVSGINRSVSIACAFLAVENKTTFEEELAKIKLVRPFVNPTPQNTALAKEYIERYK